MPFQAMTHLLLMIIAFQTMTQPLLMALGLWICRLHIAFASKKMMNNDHPPASKLSKWLLHNNKSSLPIL